MCQATEVGGGSWPLTTFLWMLQQSETTYQSPSALSICTNKTVYCILRITATVCLLNIAKGCFTCHAYSDMGRRCPVPALVVAVFGKHTVTGRPLTLCLDEYSVSMATLLQTHLLPLIRLQIVDCEFWQYDMIWLMERYFYFRMTEGLYSLSVCGLVDNRSAVVCVLRSLADLCSVLPPCSGLAASQSPNILYLNHTFSIFTSDKQLHILELSLFLFMPTFAPSLCHSRSWSIVNIMCSRHNYVFLLSTHILGLKTVVGYNESASYETNSHSVWQGMPVVALVMAMLAALCGVIVTKVTPLLSTAVTRRQTQAQKNACVWNRMWKTSPQPPQGNLVFPVNSRL